MRWAFFYHSLVSDWNHGNAHFLRGVVSDLLTRGHEVTVFEPRDGWSRRNLQQRHGNEAVHGYRSAYPQLRSTDYEVDKLDVERVLDGYDVVLVHEWNEPELIRRLGNYRLRTRSCKLLFHDTHHRSVTSSSDMRNYDLRHFDGVLAYGKVIRDIYVDRGWHDRAWTWHEAADVRVFHPTQSRRRDGDLIWIGNWGDGERTEDLQEFLLEPVKRLRLKSRVHGVRYPKRGQAALADAGIEYRGWLPNYRVPEAFSRFRVTMHIPRRPYREQLHGVPTIRVFEALACGIPLITAPWQDAEGLFRPGQDYLIAHDGLQMRQLLRDVLNDSQLAESLTRSGRETIHARHTCRHRVNELLAILSELGVPKTAADSVTTQQTVPGAVASAAPTTPR